MPLFKSLFEFKSLDDVAEFFHTAAEYKGFNIENSRECVTAYRVEILHGIAYIKECISVKDSFEVKLSYQSMPLSLPNFIANAEGSKLTSLHMLVNLPNYCKNPNPSTETDVILKRKMPDVFPLSPQRPDTAFVSPVLTPMGPETDKLDTIWELTSQLSLSLAAQHDMTSLSPQHLEQVSA